MPVNGRIRCQSLAFLNPGTLLIPSAAACSNPFVIVHLSHCPASSKYGVSVSFTGGEMCS